MDWMIKRIYLFSLTPKRWLFMGIKTDDIKTAIAGLADRLILRQKLAQMGQKYIKKEEAEYKEVLRNRLILALAGVKED